MTALIIEDEYPAAERLEKLIGKADARVQIVGVLESVSAALAWLRVNPPVDLIFSDIQLSDGLSFQIFESFPVRSPVIFTTSYDEYAIRAFRVNSIDYLLKPIKLPELASALAKYQNMKQALAPGANAEKIESLLTDLARSQRAYKTRFLVKHGDQFVPVGHEQVAYFYTANELTCLVGHDGRQYIIEHTLEELESLIDPLSFFRLNRQFIAQVSAIRKIHTYFNGKLKIDLWPAIADEVLVSREKAPAFKAWLDQ
ncbi:LytR/AlgR family response regulator transcription factor [Spirosoma montaniterrae]|uniref:LytTR family transcriptional regulator n=1 Tax=Spirosoma montaniterrae TaxID=1178516 RepID=A0A1P9WZ95_9BACT|nr:LytTR family DNA-binding domain-containing protein [Spirosoma montaniterrae]AQG80706.1 LytTR family transcriptional regulator [Spirosoma montaniterrae]